MEKKMETTIYISIDIDIGFKDPGLKRHLCPAPFQLWGVGVAFHELPTWVLGVEPFQGLVSDTFLHHTKLNCLRGFNLKGQTAGQATCFRATKGTERVWGSVGIMEKKMETTLLLR